MYKETMSIRAWDKSRELLRLPSTADQLINTWLPSHHHDASVHFGWVQCPVGNANEGHPLFACYNLHEVYAIFISISIDQRFPLWVVAVHALHLDKMHLWKQYYFCCPSQYILGKVVYLTLTALKRTNIPLRQMCQASAHNHSLKGSSSFTFDFMNRLVLPKIGGNKSLCNIRLSLHFFSSHNKAPPHLLPMIWSICAIF